MNFKKLIITSSVISVTLISGLVIYYTAAETNIKNIKNYDKVSASIVTPSSINFQPDITPKPTPVMEEILNEDNTYKPSGEEYDINNDLNEDEEMAEEPIVTEPPFVPSTELDLDPKSITVFVNKEYALEKNFVPDDLVMPKILFDTPYYEERKLMRSEAAKALEDLFNAAAKEGYILYGISGYRSYERQKKIFLNNIVTKGKNHTLKYSAVPGTSEHQTGLAIDVSTKELKFRLITRFASTKEGKWLAENAHKYGYIIRYPKDKTEITGYAYEPWHIRYVGKGLANYLYTNQLTLDEYYQYTPSEGFDFESLYADLINYVPPVEELPEEPLDELLDEDSIFEEEELDDIALDGNDEDISEQESQEETGEETEDNNPDQDSQDTDQAENSDTPDDSDPSDDSDPEDSSDPSDNIDPEDSLDPSHNTDPGNSLDPSDNVDRGNGSDPSHNTNPENGLDPSNNTDPGNGLDPSHNVDQGNGSDSSHNTDQGNGLNPSNNTDPGNKSNSSHSSDKSDALNSSDRAKEKK